MNHSVQDISYVHDTIELVQELREQAVLMEREFRDRIISLPRDYRDTAANLLHQMVLTRPHADEVLNRLRNLRIDFDANEDDVLTSLEETLHKLHERATSDCWSDCADEWVPCPA